ncbi:hypothetical protein MKY48_17675 [Paenibacillus sp. FSL W8-0187]|uniref:hypothetical protein n=1 Tax=Paenibacillus sp. FSL W8-0187 TaxID=2921710 RepID=UPI0030D891DA
MKPVRRSLTTKNPAHVIETINKQDIKEDYWLNVFSDAKTDGYDAEGYTIISTEFLMMLNLDSWPIETEKKTRSSSMSKPRRKLDVSIIFSIERLSI